MNLIRAVASHEHVNMLEVNHHEALQIIESLAAQMKAGSPNVGRAEFFITVITPRKAAGNTFQ